MDRKRAPWWAGIAAGTVAGGAASLAGYWWQVLAWLEAFEKLAGWAQAFGGIASILFSGWFVAEQIGASQRLELERRESEGRSQRQIAARAALFHGEAVESLFRLFSEGFKQTPPDAIRVRAMDQQLAAHQTALGSLNTGLFEGQAIEGYYGLLVECALGRGWCEQFSTAKTGLQQRLASRVQPIRDACELIRKGDG
jgi:hypothetical protein